MQGISWPNFIQIDVVGFGFEANVDDARTDARTDGRREEGYPNSLP